MGGIESSVSQPMMVVECIKQLIISGTLKPGARLPIEKALAAELGVSRGPLREGVRALCIMGVLETRQGSGTYVTSLEPSLLLSPVSFMVDLHAPSDSYHLQAVRRVLETEAVGRAALLATVDELERANRILLDIEPLTRNVPPIDHEAVMDADIAFHRVIAKASGNPALEALIEALAGRTVRARLWRALTDENSGRAAHAEHEAILRALQDRDPDAARLRMGTHLLGVQDFIRDHPTESDVASLSSQ